MAIVLGLLLAVPAQAAEVGGADLALFWGIPFAGVLLSIAIWPLVAPHFWDRHYGKISTVWSLLFFVPFALVFGADAAMRGFIHELLAEYLPFILLLVALFTVSGGIYIRGNLRGSPLLNTGILLIGAMLASFMGTTGASMLLIRPLLRANDNRKHRAHVVIFFIFVVSNIGGSLTPLGDPPLFLGFLKGVTFFWTVDHIFVDTLFMIAVLLPLFFLLDSYIYRRDGVKPEDPTPDTRSFGFEGAVNFILLACVVALVLVSGIWKSPLSFHVYGTDVGLPGLVRDVGFVVVTLVSLAITPKAAHKNNEFSWEPMKEVAILFAGIFLTIIPVISMLQAGTAGPFGAIVRAVAHPDGSPNPVAYFWITGALSSVLDNAPTYLVFFNTAGGDAVELMGPLASTLAAISAGAVFMGALTYIGNAPNLMVKAIAEEQHVKMPSFFGYMIWSVGILVPLFVIMTWLFL
ncbi:MAG: sodium:proton antiporter [Ottowia sp.]|nr:sodium:proton antiporter [Ottowia sp.]